MRTLVLISLAAVPLWAQQLQVAITVDDLPFTGAASRREAARANRKLLAAFTAHGAPATGFVTGKFTAALGVDILREWVKRGFELGNHGYSHLDANALSVAEIENEITRGEAAFAPLLAAAGNKPAFFRFPFNHTGETQAKHDAVAAFLAQRGYQMAPCTIDTSDYVFNAAYAAMLAKRDKAGAARLRKEYLAFSEKAIDYYVAITRQVLGYHPPHIMLLHDNRLNADTADEILRIFKRRRFTFVPLRTALAGAAYRQPVTHFTRFGPMWAYRWAKERGVKVDGRLEPEPPAWVADYR